MEYRQYPYLNKIVRQNPLEQNPLDLQQAASDLMKKLLNWKKLSLKMQSMSTEKKRTFLWNR